MARTLKSDKTLFLATLLLVGASVVMVYSASAVQVDGQGPDAVLLPPQAVGVGRDRPGADAERDARRLPRLSAAALDLEPAWRDRRRACWPCSCLPQVNGTHRWVVARLRLAAAVRAREARGDLLHRGASRAPHASHQRHRLRDAAHRRRDRRPRRRSSTRSRTSARPPCWSSSSRRSSFPPASATGISSARGSCCCRPGWR